MIQKKTKKKIKINMKNVNRTFDYRTPKCNTLCVWWIDGGDVCGLQKVRSLWLYFVSNFDGVFSFWVIFLNLSSQKNKMV